MFDIAFTSWFFLIWGIIVFVGCLIWGCCKVYHTIKDPVPDGEVFVAMTTPFLLGIFVSSLLFILAYICKAVM